MLTISDVGPRLPRVAREAIAAHLTGAAYSAAEPGAPAAPVFVTLRNPDGSLRGCIGTLSATEPDVVQETARSAVLAASNDPRFTCVHAGELPTLHIEVSVLGAEEPIAGVAELDPRRYGVIVRDAAGRRGLLLPEVPGIDDAATQVDIARRKAGIDEHAPLTLTRFQVVKFEE